jgi:CRP-like cAMP-binding protein
LALDDTIRLLAQAPIVGLLERDALRLLAFSADTRRLRAGEVLFRRGDRSDGGYVVLHGRIALTPGSPDGGAEPEAVAGPGSLIGQVALFVRTQRPATAIALEPTEMLRLSPTLMRRVLAEFPAAALAIQAAMAEDLAGLMGDLERVRASMLRPGEG